MDAFCMSIRSAKPFSNSVVSRKAFSNSCDSWLWASRSVGEKAQVAVEMRRRLGGCAGGSEQNESKKAKTADHGFLDHPT